MKSLCLILCSVAGLHAQAVQRTVQDNPIAHGKDGKASDSGALAPGQSLESIFASSEDLNAIRDGYLKRLSGDGCSTDVSIQIAELRARVRDLESDTPAQAAAKAKPMAPQTSAEMELALLALAATWNTRMLAETTVPVSVRDAEQAKMLTLVLPAATVQTNTAPASVAQLKAEIARLTESCKAAKP